MANADRPNGFIPFGCILRVRPYVAGGSILRGDSVKRVSGGAGVSGKSAVVVGTAAGALIGVALNAAASGEVVFVADHPDQEFAVQADEADINEGTDIGLNFDLLATAGSSGQSAHELDSSTGAATATLPLKLLRLQPAVDNALGAQAKVVVKINNHQLAGGTGVAGV
jgi:hypothetical protein